MLFSRRAVRLKPRFHRVMLLAAPMALLFGCSSGASQRGVLRVTDAVSGAPVAGARVEALAMEFFLPVDPFPTLDPASHPPSRVMTTNDGAATLRLPADLPVRLTVEAAGYERLQAIIEPSRRRGPTGAAPRWWISGVTHTPPVGATAPIPRLAVEILPP
ncbi:MAG: carboxypeptidase regulatory-like domain-containing protein [Phycisphaeraceae bacterium]|nr:hypothetical protein [Phycisphaerales bacterium]QOJ17449.1 MAG: carboxypeptidase regulatory-like domain-containing protein [Phycisphaeraceae bacterium]